MILKLLINESSSKNPDWKCEPRPAAEVKHHKPDILGTDPFVLQYTIIMDFTIRNASSHENLPLVKDEKLEEYAELRPLYVSSEGARIFSVHALWFGARGVRIQPQFIF